MGGEQTNVDSKPAVGGGTVVAAGLLLVALAVVVLYTNQGAFLDPIALVVVAAIGVAALLLQRRLRPSLSSLAADRTVSARVPLGLNALGVVFGLVAFCTDVLHKAAYTLFAALVAVVAFSASGIVLIRALRKKRV